MILLGAVIGCSSSFAWWHHRAVTFDTPLQPILLDSGQVYYGHVEDLGTVYPVVTDVYYVQSQTNPQTKGVTSILVRCGRSGTLLIACI